MNAESENPTVMKCTLDEFREKMVELSADWEDDSRLVEVSFNTQEPLYSDTDSGPIAHTGTWGIDFFRQNRDRKRQVVGSWDGPSSEGTIVQR